jgi:hypothetical protein
VAPLAADPAIQQAVVNQLTAQIFTYLDVQGLTNQAVDALAARGLRPQLADRLRGFAGPLASGIQSQAFADAWTQANRVAHQALVKALTGQGDGAVTVEGDTITLNLAPSSRRSSSGWSRAGSAWPSGSGGECLLRAVRRQEPHPGPQRL